MRRASPSVARASHRFVPSCAIRTAHSWHKACTQLANRADAAGPCDVTRLHRPFCIERPPGDGHDGRLSREGPPRHLPWMPRVSPPAEERLCVNEYVLMRACVLAAHECSACRLRWSARRRRCWPGCCGTRRAGMRAAFAEAPCAAFTPALSTARPRRPGGSASRMGAGDRAGEQAPTNKDE